MLPSEDDCGMVRKPRCASSHRLLRRVCSAPPTLGELGLEGESRRLSHKDAHAGENQADSTDCVYCTKTSGQG